MQFNLFIQKCRDEAMGIFGGHYAAYHRCYMASLNRDRTT